MADFAIVVGINKYQSLTDLKYAEFDAQNVSKVLLFTQNSPSIPAKPKEIWTYPTYGIVRTFITSQFKTPILDSGSNLWFFFAGHGQREKNIDYLMLLDSGDFQKRCRAYCC
jgi:uncharacterized caspase-like protein